MSDVNLFDEIAIRAEQVERTMASYLLGFKSPERLYGAVSHLPLAGGKRLRPVMAILACEAVCGAPRDALGFGVALELMHAFTLVHDDIMDRSDVRRGKPTVHVDYGENTAILAGDVLFAQGFELISGMECDSILRCELINETATLIREICEGQQLDIEFEKRDDVDETEYFEMARKKTSIIFETALRGGALIGGGGAKEINALAKFGVNYGLAFQLWDDYLDLVGEGKEVGKTLGRDICNGKKTLIAVHALKSLKGDAKERFMEIFGQTDASKDEVALAVQILEDNGSIGYAKDVANAFAKKAVSALDTIPDNLAKQILISLANYAVERTH